ncbi:fimbria/pilus periplasmic chaperone [Achromobacter xylosoxidans]
MARVLRGLAVAIWAGWISLAAVPVQAATLQISPVLVDLAPQQGATGILLRNPGATPIYGQVRVYAWDQAQGDDVLTPTQEIQASPPIIQVPPNGEQLVRLVRVSKELAPMEQSYRLVIDEIPDPATSRVNGVVLRMRYSVPVFVAGATPEPAPELAWHLARQGKEWVLGWATAAAAMPRWRRCSCCRVVTRRWRRWTACWDMRWPVASACGAFPPGMTRPVRSGYGPW